MEIKIKNWFDKKDKIDFNNESSNEIRKKIKFNKEYEEQGKETIEKRKENTLGELIGEELETILLSGFIILVFGLIYLGSIPTYFGVNDLIVNNSNMSGMNMSMTLLRDVGTNALVSLYELPKEKSVFWINGINFWFWTFWIAVFYFMVLPVIKIIYYIIKRWNKKTKAKTI